MTRINTINPSDLTNEWLTAAFREYPRIPNMIRSGKAKVNLDKIPQSYRLGTGHCLFFYNKLVFIKRMHDLVCLEMDKRNIKRDPLICVNLHDLPTNLCNDWEPSTTDHDINIERLQERFDLRKRAYHITQGNTKHIINCEDSFNQYLNTHLIKYYETE